MKTRNITLAAVLLIVISVYLMPVVSAELDSTLVVYIGAHPDDIDIGMSGSLYKYDAQIHPILWIVATDGGGDDGEYTFESSRKWLTADGFYNFSVPYNTPATLSARDNSGCGSDNIDIATGNQNIYKILLFHANHILSAVQ